MLLPSLQSLFLSAVWWQFSWPLVKLPESTSTGMGISLQWWYQCLLNRETWQSWSSGGLSFAGGQKGWKNLSTATKNCCLVLPFPDEHRSQQIPGLAFYPESCFSSFSGWAAGIAVPVLCCCWGLTQCCVLSRPPCCEGGVSLLCESWWPSTLPRAGSCRWAPRQASTWPTQAWDGAALLLACVLGALFPISSIPLFQRGALMYIDNKEW